MVHAAIDPSDVFMSNGGRSHIGVCGDYGESRGGIRWEVSGHRMGAPEHHTPSLRTEEHIFCRWPECDRVG